MRDAAHNLKWYASYQAASNALAWLPIFFLYFNQYVTLEEVISLSAFYYLAVVISEVPSGYFSDRYGRRITLICSSLLMIAAYLVFIIADGFSMLLVGEVLLAFGIAFQSGSDSALLYDSLVEHRTTHPELATSHNDEYATLESKARQAALLAMSLACFVGGILGTINLVLPYVLALIGALIALGISVSFVEPSNEQRFGKHVLSPTPGIIKQLRICFSLLHDRLLAWLFLVSVVAYSLQHIPYEFYQPYIRLLSDNNQLHGVFSGEAPLVAGVITGLSMFGGVLGARSAMVLLTKLGLKKLMISGALAQIVIIAGLALFLHPAMLLLVLFRNFPMAMTHGPLMGAIAPRVASAQRATFLSLQSLAGRFAFSLTLFALARFVGRGQDVSWPALSSLLQASVIGGVICVALIFIVAPRRFSQSEDAR
ncbi:MAG: MFS transporter [Granulosicoccus sp.]